jgi:ABC-type phosphate transport system substrate-binding protein
MKKHRIVLGALFVAASAASVNASAANLQGSDTLEIVTQNLIKICEQDGFLTPGALAYIGGGTTTGETAMRATPPTQSIAPMSRPLNDSGTTDYCNGTDGNTHQLSVARDALVFMTKASNFTNVGGGTQCDALRYNSAPTPLNVSTDRNGVAGLQVPGGSNGPTAAGNYVATDWKDILKVAYFGIHHNNIDGTTPAADCNSDVRWELLNDFRNLSNNAADCSGASCGVVTHLWRRDDVSGTTDTFKSLLGVSSSAAFCNGSTVGVFAGDEKDNDPIRRPCQGTPAAAGADQVCGCDGKLGVVQAITVPAGYTNAQLYNQPQCGSPRALAQVGDTATGPTDKCLAGFKTAANANAEYSAISQKCVVPLSASGAFGCRWQSTPITLSTCDNRVWNREARDPVTGNLLTNPDNGRPVLNAVYRIRPECQFTSATEQIGCLANTYGCSAGYAGFEATTIASPPATFKLNGVAASELNAHEFLEPGSTVGGLPYPFARKLFINSIAGFETLVGSPAGFNLDQSILVEQCAKNAARMQSALTGVGAYVGLDATGYFGASGLGDYAPETVACPD